MKTESRRSSLKKVESSWRLMTRKNATEKTKPEVKFSILKYVQEYSQATSFHGIGHIFHPQRHYIERCFWILMVGLSIYGFGLLVRSNIVHFQDGPTVISLERDFRVWNTTFPAVTICYEDPMDLESAENLVLRKWGNSISSNDSFNHYLRFLSAVANTSFMSLENFFPYVDDPTLNNEDLLPLALEVTKKFNGGIYIYSIGEVSPKQTLTEVGLCYTVGSLISDYISPWQFKWSPSLKNGVFGLLSAGKRKNEEESNEPQILECNILNSLCYGRFTITGGKISYYVHSAFEVPVWGSQKFTLMGNGMKEGTIFTPLITVASQELRELSQTQRKCLFLDEGQKNDGLNDLIWDPSYTGLPIVSYNLCIMSCRRKLAFHYCGCVPHFWSSQKLRKLDGPIYLVRDGDFKCDCYPQCDDVSFLLESKLSSSKGAPVNNENIKFRVAVEHFARIRLRREIIFGIEDLLVSLGGTAGLFLGCSLLSAAELIYFFSLRLCCYLCRKRQNKVKRSEEKNIKREKKIVTFKSPPLKAKTARNCQVLPTPGI